MSSYWGAEENEYVDVMYDNLLIVLFRLKLIKTHPLSMSMMSNIEVYNRLMRYK